MRPKAPKHGRVKPKYKPTPNASEKKYHVFLREKGCEVCEREPSIHHIISDGFKRISKDHLLVTPLCPEHHQGDQGIHAIGHDAFTSLYGINLFDRAKENYQDWISKS
jgi:hypothetical protein